MNANNKFIKDNRQKNSRRKFLEKLGFGSLMVGAGGNQYSATINKDYEDKALKNNAIWDPFDFGAKGDGMTLDTNAIQAAIDACHLEGGGNVYLKNGTFLSGTIYLKSHVTLYIDAGAVLKASPAESDYQYSGHQEDGYHHEKFYYLILAEKQEQISIIGQGTILGTGKDDLRRRRGQIRKKTPFRIGILHFIDCKQINVKDIIIYYSDFWTLHFYLCERIFIDGISILNNYYHTNSDGIDLVSCKDVFISNCLIVAGDDCICPKTKNGFPCEDLVVSNCVLESVATAIKFGTGSEGDFRDMHFTNCTIRNSGVGVGFFIKDGGTAEKITFSSLTIETTKDLSQITDGLINTMIPIFMDIEKRHDHSLIGAIQDITFRDIYIDSGANSLIQGMRDSPIENLVLENITIRVNKGLDFSQRMRRGGGYAPSKEERVTEYIRQPTYFSIAHINDLFINNVRVLLTDNIFEQYDRSAIALFEINRGMIQNVNRQPAGSIDKREPILSLHNCMNTFIYSCYALPDTNSFIGISGEQTMQIVLKNIEFGNAKAGILKTAEVPHGTVIK